jgi:hypothetical protein
MCAERLGSDHRMGGALDDRLSAMPQLILTGWNSSRLLAVAAVSTSWGRHSSGLGANICRFLAFQFYACGIGFHAWDSCIPSRRGCRGHSVRRFNVRCGIGHYGVHFNPSRNGLQLESDIGRAGGTASRRAVWLPYALAAEQSSADQMGDEPTQSSWLQPSVR